MQLLLLFLSFFSLPFLLQAQGPPPASVIATEAVRQTIAEIQSVRGSS